MNRNGMTDILSGLMAGGVFLLFYLLIDAGLILALVLGILGFVGGQFLFHRKETTMEFVADGLTQDHVDQVVAAGKEQVKRIKNLSMKIGDVKVRDEVKGICRTADEIFDNFVEDPKDIKTARKFLSYYLDTTERILDRYVTISSKSVRDSDIEETLAKVEDMLSLIDETFKKQMKKLLEDDVLDLDIELEVLEKTIKSEGI